MQHCAICLEDFVDQAIGIPEPCEHAFCFSCLVEWTKKDNSCPNDRQKFEYICKKYLVSSHKPYAKVHINNTQTEIYLEEDYISCHACNNDEQEYDPLLTCTRCSKRYHEFCLNSSDTSLWMCPLCGCNNKERTEDMDNLPVIRRARTRIITFGIRDQDRTRHPARPLRHLQQTDPQHSNRSIGNLINRNTSSSNSTIQIREKSRNNRSVRSVITPQEAARRIAESGIPIQSPARSSVLTSQAQNMAILKRKRKRVARLPSRIPINQLPRIHRRTDAPLRPCSKAITQKTKSPTNASFINQLLHSQKQLLSLQNVQMRGAYIKLS